MSLPNIAINRPITILMVMLSISFIGADVVNITVYGLLLLILIVRPQGLMGRPASREKL